jgi:hypothetical protein
MSKIKGIGTGGPEKSLARRSALKRIAVACGAIGGAVAGFGRTGKSLAGGVDVNGPGGSHVSTYVSQGKHNVTYSSSAR